MPEPTAAGGLVAAGITSAAVPVLTVFGVSLGLRADVLLAGFLGAAAAITLLNTVPGSLDTWRELVKTSFRRVGVAVASSVTAGYLVPAMAPEALSQPALLWSAFVVGAGAQQLLALAVELRAKRMKDLP